MSSEVVVDLKQLKIACQNCRMTEICLPRGLDQGELEKLNDIVGRNRPLKRGESLYRQGAELHSFYAVHSGTLRSYTVTQDGTEQTMGFYLTGELVGLDGLETGIHSCTTEALETTSICEIPYDRLQNLCSELPSLQHQMLRLMGKEISGDQDAILLLGSRTAEERLAAFLLSLSRRFSERGFSASEFNLSMSRHDIANYLGVAVETISRQFSNFDKDGILSVKHRNVKILDLSRLEAIVIPCQKSEASAIKKPSQTA
jgi:CRP/FNR family transcriptional regulator